MTFRCLIFSAVSTEAQAAEDRASLDVQLAQCRAACAARGWTVLKELRVEGHSRAYTWLHQLVADCPEYGELVRWVESEAGELVVCAAYDRLWRTDALRAQLMALCREHGVQVFSVAQPVEPVSPELLEASDTARLSEVLFGFISEQENRQRVRRRKAGMEQGRVLRRGLHHATRVLYGYQRAPSPNSPMQPLEPAASHLRWAFERRAEGWSLQRIARELNARGVPAPGGPRWLGSSLRRLLLNEVYTGVAHWGSARNESGAHPALVDPSLWARVQAVNRNHSALADSFHVTPRLLTGLVKCGHCGWGCGYLVQQAKYPYLRCTRHAQDHALCVTNSWRAEVVEAHVRAEVKAALANPADWEAARRKQSGNGRNAERLAVLDGALADARARLGRWDGAYETGGITLNELLLHRQEITGQVEAVSAERTDLLAAQRALASGSAHLAEMAGILPDLDSMPPEALRGVLRLLVARIRLFAYPTRCIEIDWL